MKTKEVKPLKEAMLEAVNKVLKANNTDLTRKIDKVVKKFVKQIDKRNNKQIGKVIKY